MTYCSCYIKQLDLKPLRYIPLVLDDEDEILEVEAGDRQLIRSSDIERATRQ